MSGKASGPAKAPGEPAPAPALSERLSKRVALIASIIGIFVTLNTVITSCTNGAISQAAGYRAAMRAEEDFWAGLYARYLDVVEQPPADLEQRRAKLMAIAMMAGREPARFDEYRVWYSFEDPVDDKAVINLVRMRGAIHSALADPSVSSPAVASDIGYYLAEQGERVQERQDGGQDAATPPPVTDAARQETIVTEQAQPPPAPADLALGGSALRPVYGNTIVATGAADGWDVDVFWCVGEEAPAAENFARAMAVANALAAQAASRAAIAGSDLKLGRVRLRSLPQSQQLARFFAGRDAITFDRGAGEQAAAGRAAAFVERQAGIALQEVRSGGAQTRWYLSLFLCSATPPPARLAGAG